ncbi:MAG TPA: glycosyltransferase family 4 protein [Thermoleophilaceae bacterium]|nr:glycosyltransferase family 4 protein [Thermoleophilaceae bacterium]
MSSLGFLFAGDSRRPSAWSGVPYGLGQAFASIGVEIEHVAAAPGRAGRLLNRVTGGPSDTIAEARQASDALARNLRRARPVEAFVQLGSEFVIPATDTPIATYDDMTVIQARRLDHPLLQGMSDAELDAWVERQREALERASVCCAMTSWVRDSVVADYGIPESRVHVVGLGRNLSPEPVERDWSTPRYLFMGQDWTRKNGPAVVAAFQKVRAEIPDATLTLLGAIPPLDEPGVHVQEPLFLNDPAERRKMEKLYEGATCLVLPSLIEPGAIAHLESAMAGVPSIGTTVGGVCDLVGDTGRLVDPHDSDALVRAMLELADGELARRLGAAARERAQWYTWPQAAARIADTLGIEHSDPVA